MKKINKRWFIILAIIIAAIIIAIFLINNQTPIKNKQCIPGYILDDDLCITDKTDFSCTGKIISTKITGRGNYICDYPIYNIDSIANYEEIISKNEALFVRGKIWKQYPINPDPQAQLIIDSKHPYNYFDVQSSEIINSSIQGIPVITDNNNITGNYKITLKARNPQYKQGSEIFFIYEIENLDNKTFSLPKNINSGIEIKNSIGTAPKLYASSDKLMILKEYINIPPLRKISSEFSINGDDFELTGLDSGDGSYYAINIYIGNVKSNKAMVRILK